MAMDPVRRGLQLAEALKGLVPADPLTISVTDRIAMIEQMAGMMSAMGQIAKGRIDQKRGTSDYVPPVPEEHAALKALLIAYRDLHPEATMGNLTTDLSQGNVPIELVRRVVQERDADLYLLQPIADGYPALRAAAEAFKADTERRRSEGLATTQAMIAELEAKYPDLREPGAS